VLLEFISLVFVASAFITITIIAIFIVESFDYLVGSQTENSDY